MTTIVPSSATNADVIALAVKFVAARVEHQLATVHAADHAALIASGMSHGEIVDRLVVRAIKAMTPEEVAQAAAQALR